MAALTTRTPPDAGSGQAEQSVGLDSIRHVHRSVSDRAGTPASECLERAGRRAAQTHRPGGRRASKACQRWGSA